jgi:hypothetical protein
MCSLGNLTSTTGLDYTFIPVFFAGITSNMNFFLCAPETSLLPCYLLWKSVDHRTTQRPDGDADAFGGSLSFAAPRVVKYTIVQIPPVAACELVLVFV